MAKSNYAKSFFLVVAGCLVVGWFVAGCKSRSNAEFVPFPVERLEIRLAETEPGDGLVAIENQSFLIPVHDTGKKFFLHPEGAVKGNEDFAEALIEIPDDEIMDVYLKFKFTEAGGEKMARLTAKEHVGKRLAVLIDGKLRSAPTFRETVREYGRIWFPREEAQQMAKAVGSSRGWSEIATRPSPGRGLTPPPPPPKFDPEDD
jgi:hypothetical protein